MVILPFFTTDTFFSNLTTLEAERDSKSKKEDNDQEYYQVSHLTRYATWESDSNTRKYHIQERQEVSPFPAGDHKAARNRQYSNNGPQREKTCLRGFANNTGAYQPAHPRSLISAFVIRVLESIICKLATYEISIF